jgi:hypothetical protein
MCSVIFIIVLFFFFILALLCLDLKPGPLESGQSNADPMRIRNTILNGHCEFGSYGTYKHIGVQNSFPAWYTSNIEIQFHVGLAFFLNHFPGRVKILRKPAITLK